MLKILYAANNTIGGRIQLDRFIEAMSDLPFIIKIAAYKMSSPPNVSIDWTLDSLQNMFKPEHITLDNDNFDTYFDQVKQYNPDLIISDMEYYSSEIASSLGITLWQCSSSLINFAITNDYKYNLGVFSKHAFLLSRSPVHMQRLINIQDNANCNYVYSHFGDCQQPPPLKNGYEWVRPYHKLGRNSAPCKHHIVGAMLGSNKAILNLLKRYEDAVCFTDFAGEHYSSPIIKDINNQEEYYCNIRNSQLFVCEGQSSFLADAFYNGKYSITLTSADDLDSIINSSISEKLKLSGMNQSLNIDLPEIAPYLNNGGQFLHERIMEL